MGDKVDELKEDVQSLGSSPKGLFQMLSEVKSMVTSSPGTATTSALQRSIQQFQQLARSSNITSSWSSLQKKAQQLRGLARQEQALPRKRRTMQVAENVAKAAVHINELALSRSKLLGVYKRKSHHVSLRQRQLLHHFKDFLAEGVLNVDQYVAEFLLELDKTWWPLRRVLEDYYEQAQVQVQTYSEAAAMLQDYTSSCHHDFRTVHAGYKKVMAIEDATHKVLQESWRSAANFFGLLAAKISDGDGFWRLAKADLGRELPHTENFKLHLCNGNASLLMDSVNDIFAQGLAGQTLSQVLAALDDIALLVDRMYFAGLPVKTNAVEQAAERIVTAWSDAKDSYMRSRLQPKMN